MALTRKLAYKDRYVLEVEQTVNEAIDFNSLVSFPDFTTPIILSVQWTQLEYTRILSALMTGADLSYPYESHQIEYDFMKMVVGQMTCEQIIDCLENDTDTQQAVANLLAELGIQPTAGEYPPSPMSTSQSADNLLPAGYVCDNDHLFGMSRWIVQKLDESTKDLLQKIELLTNDAELLAVFSDNVEGVSWFGSGLELAAWIQDQLIEWYEGAYTGSVEDDLACEIYCLIKDDCELTIDKILQAYAVHSFSTPSAPDDWLDVLEWLVSTNFDGSIGTVATYHYFLVQALRYASKIPLFDGFRGMKQIISLGANQTDSNWNILCDCPLPVQTAEWDFTVTDGGFVQTAGATARGVYVGGVGWTTEFNGNEGCLIQVELPANTVIKELSFDWDKDTAQSWAINGLMRDNPSSATGQIVFFLTNSTALSGCANGVQEGATHRNYLMIQIANGSVNTMEGHITKCRIRYEGDTPALVTSTGITVACP